MGLTADNQQNLSEKLNSARGLKILTTQSLFDYSSKSETADGIAKKEAESYLVKSDKVLRVLVCPSNKRTCSVSTSLSAISHTNLTLW